jgi:NAD+ diphosphatase
MLSAMNLLDRQSARRHDEAYLNQLLAAPQTQLIALVGAKPVIRSNAERTAATLATIDPVVCPGGPPKLDDVMFLGVDTTTGTALFARSFTAEQAQALDPQGATLAPAVDLRSLAMQGVLAPQELGTAATAAALQAWHDSARFCGRCAAPTVSRNGGWSRHCGTCNVSHFPRTDPVVIMLVTAGDKCVLARQSAFPENMVSAIAGFLEPGETIETAVIRETEEEIGIRVHDVTYLASQPWPFPHTLMIGCRAETTHHPLKVDPSELESAQWVSRQDTRRMLANTHPDGLWVPGPHAIARTLISLFAQEKI